MFPDFVQKTIDSERESFFSSCANCEYAVITTYTEGGEICCGKVRHPHKEVPFDIIRLCMENGDGESLSQHNLTPDEAMEVVTNLPALVGEWMVKTKAYQGFRWQQS